MNTQSLPETEHFKIQHSHWNCGTLHHEFAVVAKPEKTKDSRAMIPMPVTANSPEALIADLLQTEECYVKNRFGIDRKAELIDAEQLLAEFRSQISTVQKQLREEAALLDRNLAVLEAFIAEGSV